MSPPRLRPVLTAVAAVALCAAALVTSPTLAAAVSGGAGAPRSIPLDRADVEATPPPVVVPGASFAAVGATLSPSTTAAAPTTTTPPAPVRASIDLGDGLVIEVITPAGPGPHPTVVYVHGGGWVAGHHRDLPPGFGLADLTERGWALASVGYRLADRDAGIDAADQVADVVRAIGWLRADGSELGLDGRLVGLGHSAGGHLLAMAATTMAPDLAPDVVIGVAGVYDFGDDVVHSPLLVDVMPDALGCEPATCPDGWLNALSPGTHADAGDPPVVLLHGDADRVVPVRTSVDFAAALSGAGVSVELVVVEGADHFAGLFPAVQDALGRVLGS